MQGKWLEQETQPDPTGHPKLAIEGTGVARRVPHVSLNLASHPSLRVSWGSPLLLETPANIHLVEEADMALALDWRLKVRQRLSIIWRKATWLPILFQAGDPVSGGITMCCKKPDRNYWWR